MANITLRRSPWRSPLGSMFDRDQDYTPTSFRHLFNAMLEPALPSESVGLMPAVEIAETPEEFMCTTELPGMKQADIDLSFDDGVLMIKGEKRDEREKKDGKQYHLWERSYGTFARTFTFPTRIDAEKITANFSDGVLTVHLPKAAEAKLKARSIAIK
jgi:HSP20 family protein